MGYGDGARGGASVVGAQNALRRFRKVGRGIPKAAPGVEEGGLADGWIRDGESVRALEGGGGRGDP